jgi:hypothetical protein
MSFEFVDQKPQNCKGECPVISGEESLKFEQREYLILRKNGEVTGTYEIRYEYQCSPFKEAELIDGVLAVGYQEHFYLFDLEKSLNILTLKMSGYFGHIYLNEDLIYVADSSGIYCLDSKGERIWQNINLGIDGVLIHDFGDSKIYGSGEWDPPGGWIDFVLDLKTGIQFE